MNIDGGIDMKQFVNLFQVKILGDSCGATDIAIVTHIFNISIDQTITVLQRDLTILQYYYM